MNPSNIIVCGPTCSGKSGLALRIAQKTGGVIINADSQQVYSELPILSAQPTEEEKKLVPHHLYSAMSGAELCTVARWLEMALEKISQLSSSHSPLIFVGGTGLYFQSLFYGLAKIPEVPDDIRREVRDMEIEKVAELLGDEADGNNQRMRRALEVKLYTNTSIKEWHNKPHDHPFKPADFKVLHVGVPRETLYKKINDRVLVQVEKGALDEVRNLHKMNLNPELPIMKAHGAPEFIRHFKNEISLDEAISKAQQNVRNYAKRQMTWFRNQLPHHINISPDITDAELVAFGL